jgi:hypothetical protein
LVEGSAHVTDFILQGKPIVTAGLSRGTRAPVRQERPSRPFNEALPLADRGDRVSSSIAHEE